MNIHVLGSSVRTRDVSDTVRIADQAALALGVTRCVDVTRLDRVGIPVFTATRPRAPMVCVTAGKGRLALEAEVGALMEAIEQQVAFNEATFVQPIWMSARDALAKGSPKLAAFAPRLRAVVDVDQPIPWLSTEVRSSAHERASVPVPAEVILCPCPAELRTDYFGSSTTGLASGNSVEDAMLHGLCEVIERDITSFEAFSPTSRLVNTQSMPSLLTELTDRLNSAGLRAWLRWVPNDFGVAYFCALVVDDDQPTPILCNGGYGCHPDASIAAVRALTEAAQSRLSFIQGAREDLDATYAYFGRRSEQECATYRDQLISRFSSVDAPVAFESIPTKPPVLLSRSIDEIVGRVVQAGLGPVLTYRYIASPADLAVVRVLVPGAEQWRNATMRAGSRLVRHVRTLRSLDV